MAFYQFKAEQFIKTPIAEVWDFVSSPRNLSKITPDNMAFDITSGALPEKMYPGMIITYKVSPLLGIKINWMTEITHVKDGEYFVDEQRKGPFSLWHHQHHLKEQNGGVLMEDIVTYAPPLGILGAIANSIMIKKKLKEIFAYRTKAVEDYFGK